jgi:hypothetical protein
MPREVSPGGARFKVWKFERRQLRLLSFGADFVHPEWCTKGHTGMILEGSMEVEFSGDKKDSI